MGERGHRFFIAVLLTFAQTKAFGMIIAQDIAKKKKEDFWAGMCYAE